MTASKELAAVRISAMEMGREHKQLRSGSDGPFLRLAQPQFVARKVFGSEDHDPILILLKLQMVWTDISRKTNARHIL